MWRRYRVNYQYIEPFGASFRDSDFPEPLHKVDEVDKELLDAEKRKQSEKKTKTKWLISSDECSVSCGGGSDNSSQFFLEYKKARSLKRSVT